VGETDRERVCGNLPGALYRGVEHRVYVHRSGDQLEVLHGARRAVYADITPIRDTETLGTDPVNTVDGSTTVTIDDAAHGAAMPAPTSRWPASPAALNGVPAVGAQRRALRSRPSSLTRTSYTIDGRPQPATATARRRRGGRNVAAYQINPGLDTAVANSGWGASPWGGAYFGVATDIGWGDAASIVTLIAQLRLWSQDSFGEDLVINPRGGGVYYHDLSAGGRAVDLAGVSGALDVPTVCNQVLVSEVDRHIFAYGCNEEGGTTINRMLVRWSSQTSLSRPTGYKDWQTRTDNTAGGQQLDHGSEIVRAIRCSSGPDHFQVHPARGEHRASGAERGGVDPGGGRVDVPAELLHLRWLGPRAALDTARPRVQGPEPDPGVQGAHRPQPRVQRGVVHLPQRRVRRERPVRHLELHRKRLGQRGDRAHGVARRQPGDDVPDRSQGAVPLQPRGRQRRRLRPNDRLRRDRRYGPAGRRPVHPADPDPRGHGVFPGRCSRPRSR
jgi:hypothetical protein